MALLASDPSAVTVPASVAVPEGATQATFDITTNKRETATSVDITGQLWGETKLTSLTVSATPKISGTVTLSDFTGDKTSIPVTVEIRQAGSTTVVESYTVNLNSSGAFSLLTVQQGNFNLAFKASHWLRKVLPNVAITTSGASGESASLINGDINGDNAIDSLDFNKLSLAWRSVPGGAKWNANADLNGNGVVDAYDWNTLSKNWRKTGDL